MSALATELHMPNTLSHILSLNLAAAANESEQGSLSSAIAQANHDNEMADLEALQSLEAHLFLEISCDMDEIKKIAPAWHQLYEDCTPESASGKELIDMLNTAPNAFAKGLISGILNFRLEMAAISGRVF